MLQEMPDKGFSKSAFLPLLVQIDLKVFTGQC